MSRRGRRSDYPNAFVDEDTGERVSDAEVAEVPRFTAFTSRRKSEQVTARLIVRRVRRLNPDTATGKVPAGQEELFTTWRYHAVFTDSPEAMLDAEATHRQHAVVEQVIAGLKNGPKGRIDPAGVAERTSRSTTHRMDPSERRGTNGRSVGDGQLTVKLCVRCGASQAGTLVDLGFLWSG